MYRPKAKRRKLISKYEQIYTEHIKYINKTEATKKKTTEIVNLDMKCIFKIFEYLSPNDLISMSQTCKKFQKYVSIAIEDIQPKPNRAISIELTENRIVEKFDNISDIYLRGKIRIFNLTSYIYDQDPTPLFYHINMHCDLTPHEINMIRLNFQQNVAYGELICYQLNRLKTISFDRCSSFDIHNNFLKDCKHLTHLRIRQKGTFLIDSDSWKHHHYDTIESFTFWAQDDRANANLDAFLRINFQICNINCRNMKVVETVLKNAFHLDNLVIHCDKFEDFIVISKLLPLYSQKPRSFKRFELVLNFQRDLNKIIDNIEWMNRLIPRPEFQGFHVICNLKKMPMNSIIQSLTNLRTLSLKLVLDNNDLIWNLLPYLPLLECVRIYICRELHQNEQTFRILCTPFVTQLPQLEQLIVRFTSGMNATQCDDLVKLSECRLMAYNACTCTLYLENHVISTSNFIIPSGDEIRLEPISQLKRHLYLDPFIF